MKRPTKKTKTDKKKFCLQEDCKREATSKGYCRLHYIQNWQQIKLDNKARAERRLNAYIDKLSKKYPQDYVDKIREGLENDERFQQSVQEADLDNDIENSETENEFLEKFLRNIKSED